MSSNTGAFEAVGSLWAFHFLVVSGVLSAKIACRAWLTVFFTFALGLVVVFASRTGLRTGASDFTVAAFLAGNTVDGSPVGAKIAWLTLFAFMLSWLRLTVTDFARYVSQACWASITAFTHDLSAMDGTARAVVARWTQFCGDGDPDAVANESFPAWFAGAVVFGVYRIALRAGRAADPVAAALGAVAAARTRVAINLGLAGVVAV